MTYRSYRGVESLHKTAHWSTRATIAKRNVAKLERKYARFVDLKFFIASSAVFGSTIYVGLYMLADHVVGVGAPRSSSASRPRCEKQPAAPDAAHVRKPRGARDKNTKTSAVRRVSGKGHAHRSKRVESRNHGAGPSQRTNTLTAARGRGGEGGGAQGSPYAQTDDQAGH
jgi:hypothetical protein